jgi:hypothetical protein
MEINDILKAMPEKDKRTWAAERQKEGNAKKSNLQILEEMGYHHDKNMALSPYSIYKGEGDNKQYILDPTGNRNFRDKQITLSHCSQYGCDQIRD